MTVSETTAGPRPTVCRTQQDARKDREPAMNTTIKQHPTPAEFHEACGRHDWFACMSDARDVMARARVEFAELREAAAGSPVHERTLAGWLEWRTACIETGDRPRPAVLPVGVVCTCGAAFRGWREATGHMPLVFLTPEGHDLVEPDTDCVACSGMAGAHMPDCQEAS